MKYGYWLVSIGMISLTSCSSGSVKDTLGLNRSSPDEFRVVSRPPLSVPPQFTLRPPANSDAAPNQLSASQTAQGLLVGDNGAAGSATTNTAVPPIAATSAPSTKTAAKAAFKPISTSTADSQFLKNAGADKANPQIRTIMEEEKYSKLQQQESDSWWNVFPASSDKKDPLVDAKNETKRIKTNEEEGKAITAGDTPEAKAKDTGLMGRIFGY